MTINLIRGSDKLPQGETAMQNTKNRDKNILIMLLAIITLLLIIDGITGTHQCKEMGKAYDQASAMCVNK